MTGKPAAPTVLLLMALRAYLAGPDIFLPAAEQWAERKKSICAHYGLVGISPLDHPVNEPPGWSALPDWRRIAARNEALIRSCALMIANLTPFRGPSADVGTVYEVGFMRALGRPVYGYATTAEPFTQRTLDFAAAMVARLPTPMDPARCRWPADRAVRPVRQPDDRGRNP